MAHNRAPPPGCTVALSKTDPVLLWLMIMESKMDYLCRMECRIGCGACCIAPSISSPIPGMPDGKPAGVRCIHLTEQYTCGIYNHPDRPPVCDLFKADPAVCGENREEAIVLLSMLED